MKKYIPLFASLNLLILSSWSQAAFAQVDQHLCPQTVVCSGTASSCYVSEPKNYDNGFLFDDQFNVLKGSPNGAYQFHGALYNGNLKQSFCFYIHQEDAKDVGYVAKTIIFVNAVKMTWDSVNTSSWEDGLHVEKVCTYKRHWDLSAPAIAPSDCPFVTSDLTMQEAMPD